MEDPQDLLKTTTKGDSLAGPVCERARHPTLIEGRAKQKSSILPRLSHARKTYPHLSTVLVNEKKMIFPSPKTTLFNLPFRISCCLSTYHSLWVTGYPICAIQSICVFAMTINVSAI